MIRPLKINELETSRLNENNNITTAARGRKDGGKKEIYKFTVILTD